MSTELLLQNLENIVSLLKEQNVHVDYTIREEPPSDIVTEKKHEGDTIEQLEQLCEGDDEIKDTLGADLGDKVFYSRLAQWSTILFIHDKCRQNKGEKFLPLLHHAVNHYNNVNRDNHQACLEEAEEGGFTDTRKFANNGEGGGLVSWTLRTLVPCLVNKLGKVARRGLVDYYTSLL